MTEPMTCDRAFDVVGAICNRSFYASGFDAQIASLAGVTLAEMLEAKRIVEQENATAPSVDGKKIIHVVPDDRLIASVYALEHNSPSVAVPGRRLVIVPTKAD